MIFFTIVLAIYGLTNTYIFSRGLQALPPGSTYRIWFIIGFWFLVSTFILGRFLDRAGTTGLSTFLTWIGSFWLGAMLYFFLIVLFIDFVRLLNHIFHLFPQVFYADWQKTKLITFFFSVSLVLVLIIAGYINTLVPRIRSLDLDILKTVKGSPNLHIVMASDIHLGAIIGKNRAAYLVNKINKLNPDIIVLDGDIVDEDLAPVIRQNIGESLKTLKAKYGVWAITGNHEYIGGIIPAVNYLVAHNINFIRDTSVVIDNRFYLVGREDRDKRRFTGQPRKSLEEVMKNIDRSYPVILLDHQPFNLSNAAAQGVDLQLSGHTHHGQLFPVNLITDLIYEVSYGYKKIGQTHFYVSSGFGTWGPPVRIGTRAEIVDITLHFR
jgi:predicted MPP superfamily phosphohydrolase